MQDSHKFILSFLNTCEQFSHPLGNDLLHLKVSRMFCPHTRFNLILLFINVYDFLNFADSVLWEALLKTVSRKESSQTGSLLFTHLHYCLLDKSEASSKP